MSEQPNDRLIVLVLARGGSKRLPDKNLQKLGGKELIKWSISVAKRISDSVWVSTDSDRISAVAEEAGARVYKRSSDTSSDHATSLSAVLEFLNNLPLLRDCISPVTQGNSGQRPQNNLQQSESHSAGSIKDYTYPAANPAIQPLTDNGKETMKTKKTKGGKDDTFLLLLQCTSPLLMVEDLHHALRLAKQSHYDSVFSACRAPHQLRWSCDQNSDTLVPRNFDPTDRPRSQDFSSDDDLIETGHFYLTRVSLIREFNSLQAGRCWYVPIPLSRVCDIDTELDLYMAQCLLDRLQSEEKTEQNRDKKYCRTTPQPPQNTM